MKDISLHEGWVLRAVGGEVPPEVSGVAVPATVPGCVHTDLLAAGLIEDPYVDDGERATAWIGSVDWAYTTEFRAEVPAAAERAELVCEGLDTVATVELNGTVLGRTRNMHRSYRFDAGEALRSGINSLTVTFAAPVPAAERMSRELGPRPHVNRFPFNAVRKMACNYGWDWGPELVTAGIWRPVELRYWTDARLSEVRPLATVSAEDGRGRVRVHVDAERHLPTGSTARPLPVVARIGERSVSAVLGPDDGSAVLELVVDDPELWWPHSHGDSPTYPVGVDLLDDSRERVLDHWRGAVGFRDVRLDTEPDEHGTGFTFAVNGEPLFVRGANWIPDDCFPHRITRRRYAERIAQAKAAGINLLRVWGGGIYESADFYELCDEHGVMVWQDFPFACAAYAEEEPLRGEVEAEAREHVARLCRYPSLVLWNGCNENIWGHRDWGWAEELGDRSWGSGYYLDLLPRIVSELDPTRPYCAGSPWSLSTERHPNDPDHGPMHVWDVWNEVDYLVYREHVPRFAAEFGWAGPPTWATLTRAVHDDPMAPTSPNMLVHQKAENGAAKLARGLAAHLPEPANFADWHWAASVVQARAVSTGVEHFRSWSPRCAGSVVWQLNDCWPVVSWAAVDGDGRRKPLWYALRHAYADRLLTVQPRDGGLAVIAVNDSGREWSGPVSVERRGFDGELLAGVDLEVRAAARTTVCLPVPSGVADPADPAAELLLATDGARPDSGRRALWTYATERDTALPAPSFDADVERVEDGYRVSVTASGLLRDVAVLADRLAPDAVVDDMLVTLLPGERASFLVSTRAELIPSALTSPEVLRCTNQLARRGSDVSA